MQPPSGFRPWCAAAHRQTTPQAKIRLPCHQRVGGGWRATEHARGLAAAAEALRGLVAAVAHLRQIVVPHVVHPLPAFREFLPDDLDVNLYANNVGSRVGKYDIVAESGNKNYRLYYNNYENRNNRDYSTSATLTIRPQQISAEQDGVRYTFYRPDGFQYDDELVIAEVYGDNIREGAKTIKIYNNNQSMVYTDLTLTIEKIADTVQNVVMFENGAWVEKPFDAEGKIVVPYSTEQGNGFQVVVVHGSSQTKQGNETLAYCLMAGFVAIFLGSQGYMAVKDIWHASADIQRISTSVRLDPPQIKPSKWTLP